MCKNFFTKSHLNFFSIGKRVIGRKMTSTQNKKTVFSSQKMAILKAQLVICVLGTLITWIVFQGAREVFAYLGGSLSMLLIVYLFSSMIALLIEKCTDEVERTDEFELRDEHQFLNAQQPEQEETTQIPHQQSSALFLNVIFFPLKLGVFLIPYGLVSHFGRGAIPAFALGLLLTLVPLFLVRLPDEANK